MIILIIAGSSIPAFQINFEQSTIDDLKAFAFAKSAPKDCVCDPGEVQMAMKRIFLHFEGYKYLESKIGKFHAQD
jgi:hypothetical protein